MENLMQKAGPEPATLFALPNASRFLESQARALDGSMQVSKMLTDTARSLVQRQFDLLQFNLSESIKCAKALLSSETVPTLAARHLEYLEAVTIRASTEAKEMTEIAVKGTSALFDFPNPQAQKDTLTPAVKSLTKTSA